MHKAGDVLTKIFDRIATPETSAWASFCRNWPDIVGQELKDHLRPLREENGVLFLETEHPGWLQIVKFREKEVIERINQFLPGYKIGKLGTIITKSRSGIREY